MKVCGFTFVRNAVILDYPVEEAIVSILPLCDEVIVAVGKSEDDTLERVRKIQSDKIRIIETIWDDNERKDGRALALEADKAFRAIPSDADWCFYIQADEILHEQYQGPIRDAMHRHLNEKSVEGLLFKYLHFYGSYDYVGSSWSWYRREIRIIRNDKNIFSYLGAQGFRKKPNEKLQVKLVDAYIYHYGWVRDPRAMSRKERFMHQLHHDDLWMEENPVKTEAFDYGEIDLVERFAGTHPAVMQDRIRKLNWKFDRDPSKNRLSLRERLRRLGSFLLGHRIGEYKNYKII